MNYSETRPWGSFTHLYDTNFTKVKTITVQPNQRLSLQSHKKRSENWTVVQGTATIWLDDSIKDYQVGESTFIPVGTKHRLENKTDQIVEIIEVQTGSYFGEDDIIRYEDDYNREDT
ncbi:MAG: phosphomannose isomerase type II C-terminal cupin domain [Candidatus Cloacimonetes bacterium]|nr:phosphomannose isomerase type II C-terminal cupin domain [Candidatus Cloacimonadota bacterium]